MSRLAARLTKLEATTPNGDPWSDTMLVLAEHVSLAGGIAPGLYRKDKWSCHLVFDGAMPDREAHGIPPDIGMIVLTETERG